MKITVQVFQTVASRRDRVLAVSGISEGGGCPCDEATQACGACLWEGGGAGVKVGGLGSDNGLYVVYALYALEREESPEAIASPDEEDVVGPQDAVAVHARHRELRGVPTDRDELDVVQDGVKLGERGCEGSEDPLISRP